jgi:pimeloyl-ACP methyl ester carboxylesterase
MSSPFPPLLVAALLLASCATPSRPVPVSEPQPEGLDGPWHGALIVRDQPLHFDLQLSHPGGGQPLGGTFSVPMQGLRGLPIESGIFDGTRLAFVVTLPHGQKGSFEGSRNGTRWEGTYRQGGGQSPFWLGRGERPSAAPTSPATSGHPQHEVRFSHGTVTLAGTLTLPRGVVRPPVAVMISGSGAQDRSVNVFGFRLFESLAQALAEGGIATLRYDDRGIAGSTGDFHAATTHDFADDAEAAFRFLQQRADVDVQRIGLLGHSEGGVVAPIVAARNPEVAFLVLLAAPAQPLGELLVEQVGGVGRSEGQPPEKIRAHQAAIQKAVALLREDQSLGAIEDELAVTCAPACSAGDATVAQVRAQLELPWFRSFVKLDPALFLARVRAPVLALGGSLDVQVPGPSNLPLMRALLARAPNPASSVEEIEGMNHLLQAAKTGAVSEYARLPGTLEPRVPARIVEWISTAAPGGQR